MKKCDSRKDLGKDQRECGKNTGVETKDSVARLSCRLKTEETSSNNQEINLIGLPNTRAKQPERIDN